MDENSLLPLFIGGTALFLVFSFSFMVITIVSKMKHNALTMEQTRLAHQFEKELLQTKLELHEIGLSQLSREIHDNVGQSLGTVMNILVSLNKTINDENRQLLELSKSQLARAIKDLRNASHILNSDYINMIGLEESLRKEIGYISINNNIEFHLNAEGDPDNLADEKVLMIFRIAQEILTNIMKHARATQVEIKLHYQADNFCMMINDNGMGFDEKEMKNGIGLLNMKQRASLLKGTIGIHPEINKGTSVILNIPV